jgi:hypothetical protein
MAVRANLTFFPCIETVWVVAVVMANFNIFLVVGMKGARKIN